MSAPTVPDRTGRHYARDGVVVTLVCLVIAAVVGGSVWSYRHGIGVEPPSAPSTAQRLTASSAERAAAPTRRPSTSTARTAPAARSSTTRPLGRPPLDRATRTREGMWWGVDSSGPITAAAIANARGWYRGATPQFWGRYVSGHYAVSARELAFARSHGIFVYLLVNDRNCSQCDEGRDVCGRDRSAAQARTDALAAIRAARALGVPAHTVLFKDIEQVGSCRGEPTPTYLDAWYRTLRGTDLRTGFYGNAHRQSFAFPRAYCAVVAVDPEFRDDVALDMNENEPQLGAARGTVGPDNAPTFAPLAPDCAPAKAVQLWQYGESITPSNYTDIDQARPDIAGLLAPGGGVTGG